MPIEFGIFDHIERIPGVSLQQLYGIGWSP